MNKASIITIILLCYFSYYIWILNGVNGINNKYKWSDFFRNKYKRK